MNGWCIKSNGFKYDLYPSDVIDVCIMDITELVLPNHVKSVYCYINKLTELIIPDSVKYISCKGNNLTELIVPDGCVVHCDPNVKLITRTMFNRSKRLKQILK